jgi:hypothetical protein
VPAAPPILGSTGSTTIVLACVLVVLGVAMICTAVWLVRATRTDTPALGPLEVMGDRSWRRRDAAGRAAMLAAARPAGALPPAPIIEADPDVPAVAAAPIDTVAAAPIDTVAAEPTEATATDPVASPPVEPIESVAVEVIEPVAVELPADAAAAGSVEEPAGEPAADTRSEAADPMASVDEPQPAERS